MCRCPSTVVLTVSVYAWPFMIYVHIHHYIRFPCVPAREQQCFSAAVFERLREHLKVAEFINYKGCLDSSGHAEYLGCWANNRRTAVDLSVEGAEPSCCGFSSLRRGRPWMWQFVNSFRWVIIFYRILLDLWQKLDIYLCFRITAV